MENVEYQFPKVNVLYKKIIRYFSVTNPWVDFIVVVDPKDTEKADEAIKTAMIKFWNEDNYEPYGDILERKLTESEIEYQVIYHDSDDISSEYEEAWEHYVIYLNQESKCSLNYSNELR